MSGFIIHEDAERVFVATDGSKNAKTGDMIQIWILPRLGKPIEAVKTRQDDAICGDCKHRGTQGFRDRSCYVNVAQGPNSVWRAYQRGSYPKLPVSRYAEFFGGRAVRFGAYGDPVYIPLRKARAIVAVCRRHTGYTHQWKQTKFAPWREILMASVDSLDELHEARRASWRTFRVSPVVDLQSNEISCPASDEAGHRTQCAKCGLCDGARILDVRKDILIMIHGVGKRNFVALEAIAERLPKGNKNA